MAQVFLALPSESNTECISFNPSHRHGKGNEGNEGDEEEGGHEGHEGDEEEVREQDCNGPLVQGDGASWKQGEDRWWLDSQGPHQNKNGKVVSKKLSARGKKSPWIQACTKARKALKITGFAIIKKGTPLYAKAKEFYNQ